MPEDRDQLFERALARHLRAESAGESLCLDPETLAAYHERMLSPEELSSAKSHIVSCARCQEVLAQLEATQEVNQLQEVFKDLPAFATRPDQMFPGQARQPLRESHAEKLPKAVVALPRKRTITFRWAAPAGAIAAALLIWLGVRDSGMLHKPSSQAVTQVAENRPQAPSRPYREEKDEFGLPQDKALGKPQDPEKQQTAAGSAGYPNETMRSANGDVAPAPPLLDDRKDSAVLGKLEREKKRSSAYEYSMRNGAVAGARGPSAAAAQAQANSAIQRSDQGVADAAQTVEVVPAPGDLDKARVQPPAAKSDALVAAKSVPPPPPSPSRDQKQPAANAGDSELKAKNAEVRSPEVTSTGAFTVPTVSRAVSKVGLDIRIAAPSGKKIWSIGPGGQIFHSTDAGRTWLAQISGVAANLIGGSAPSDKVCWIAGAAGTLLRTTDSGLHWQEIHTPISGDLGGVHASDAKRASIWDAGNHVSYETSDGGNIWKQSANE